MSDACPRCGGRAWTPVSVHAVDVTLHNDAEDGTEQMDVDGQQDQYWECDGCGYREVVAEEGDDG